ncbi:hypothetical protein SAMN05421770_101534 [Granulicella rosea]|uniref:Uncharacterized protein n=1 Tax=Granulicella rosea TaxID=474952 RepID=A0A239DKP3_9BACT|nr:hypothetical protein [Granulicella rosea]SNS33185.1 hypothetical protein SAMN05421770_101534 [Granulicella rosea]
MGYLQPAEYQAYGLSAETGDDWIATASALIEAYCRRCSLMATEYVERIRLTPGCQTVRLSYGPLFSNALVGIRVRYGRPRRGENGPLDEPMLAQVAFAFGLPGSWSTLDLASVDLNTGPREVTFAANFLGLDYNEVEVTYTAGFVTVPVAVKVACAQIVKNAQATPALNVRSSKLDTMQMQYFSGSLIDPQVQALLRPFIAERLG